jgi:hypothetical protein
VGDPHERDKERESGVRPDPDRAEQQRQRVRVDGVVRPTADPRADQVAEHRDVGGQRQGREQPDRSVERDVPADGDPERRQPFQAEVGPRLHALSVASAAK